MKQIMVYECEYTGKRFDSKEECLQYEKIEHINNINREIRSLQKEKAESDFIESLQIDNISNLLVEWENRYNNCILTNKHFDVSVKSIQDEENSPGTGFNRNIKELKKRFDYGFFINITGEICHYPILIHEQPMYHDARRTFKFIYEYFYSIDGMGSSLLFKPKGLFYISNKQERFAEESKQLWNIKLEKGDPVPRFSVSLFLPFEYVPHIGARKLLMKNFSNH